MRHAVYLFIMKVFKIGPHGWTMLIALACATRLCVATPAQAQTSSDEPFGLRVVAVTDGSLPDRWRSLRRRILHDEDVVARCRAVPRSCSAPGAQRFIAMARDGNANEAIDRIRRINRAVNLSIRAVNDSASAWPSPLTTLATGHGNCMQYAAVKYALFRDAGFAPENLRIAIVRQKAQPADHALVAVRHDGTWLILDNRSLTIVESHRLLDTYRPLFLLDERGVWRFVSAPDAANRSPACNFSAG